MPVRTTTGEILSRGVPIGAIEAPASHELLLLQRGRPVTAGYAVVTVAIWAAQSHLGQVAPGHIIRFRGCSLTKATQAFRKQTHLLRQLARRVSVVFAELGIPCDIPSERTAS